MRTVLRNALAVSKRTSAWACCDSALGSASRKTVLTGFPSNCAGGTLQKFLRGAVYESDVAVEPGGNQSAADGLNDVLMKYLKIFQSAAGISQLHSSLPQLGAQKSRQVSDCDVGKQVYKNNCLQRFQFGMGGAIGFHHSVVIEFENGSVKNEGKCGHQMSPHSGKQDAGYDDDERVKKIQRTVPASGLMHDEAD